MRGGAGVMEYLPTFFFLKKKDTGHWPVPHLRTRCEVQGQERAPSSVHPLAVAPHAPPEAQDKRDVLCRKRVIVVCLRADGVSDGGRGVQLKCHTAAVTLDVRACDVARQWCRQCSFNLELRRIVAISCNASWVHMRRLRLPATLLLMLTASLG